MNKLTKLVALLVVISCSFIGTLEVVTRGCNHLENYGDATNINSFIESVCTNKEIKQLYHSYNVKSLNNEVVSFLDDVKSYPYLAKAKAAKYNTERYILNFDFTKELSKAKSHVVDYDYKGWYEDIKEYIIKFDAKATYASIKTHALVNYSQLRHYIFLKYQILTANKEQWKAKYNQKVQTENEVTFTDLGNIKNLVSDVKKTESTTTGEEENVPAVSGSQHEVQTYSNYGPISFEDSFATVEKQSEKMVKDMLKQMEDMETNKIKEMKPAYVEKIKQINQLANDRMVELSTMIREINNCDLIDGVYYYNQTNSECEYAPITREGFRQYFNDTKMILQQKSKNLVEVDYQSDLKELEKNLNDLKVSQVDTFEDWGDSTIEKLKDILTYENMALGQQDDDKMLSKWQNLTLLKNEIIKKRDLLVELNLDFNSMKEFVEELKKNIGVLAHEGGDRLYIIRAKANLEFQEREKPPVVEVKEEAALPEQD